MCTASVDPTDLIRRARGGDPDRLSELIDRYRPYLKLLARLQQDERLQAKLDDSDMAQEVSAQAVRDFAKFRGVTEAEFTAWLRAKMAGVAAQSLRHYTRRRRDIQLERDLQQALDHSSCWLGTRLASAEITPSEHALRRERAVLVAEALHQLPEHYREILILRDFQGLSLEQIARRPLLRDAIGRGTFLGQPARSVTLPAAITEGRAGTRSTCFG